MRTVHLIHGFNERHKLQKPRMAVLYCHLKQLGLRVAIHDYGNWDLIAVRNNRNLARLIYPHVTPGDTLVGFSNGAAVIAHLMKINAPAARLVLIQPALKKTWTPPHYVEQWTVYWNEGDIATVGGKIWRRVTGLFPWHWHERLHWGEMGHEGYLGKDERIIQFNTADTKMMPRVLGHGTWAKSKYKLWHDHIARNC